jgi:hypothetical protein
MRLAAGWLVVELNERQQRQMAGAFDFACQFTLAAGAASGLAARLNFAGFAYEALKCINILVIEAATFRAVVAAGASTSPAPARTVLAFITVAAITVAAAIQSVATPVTVSATTTTAVSTTATTRAVISIEIHVRCSLH